MVTRPGVEPATTPLLRHCATIEQQFVRIRTVSGSRRSVIVKPCDADAMPNDHLCGNTVTQYFINKCQHKQITKKTLLLLLIVFFCLRRLQMLLVLT